MEHSLVSELESARDALEQEQSLIKDTSNQLSLIKQQIFTQNLILNNINEALATELTLERELDMREQRITKETLNVDRDHEFMEKSVKGMREEIDNLPKTLHKSQLIEVDISSAQCNKEQLEQVLLTLHRKDDELIALKEELSQVEITLSNKTKELERKQMEQNSLHSQLRKLAKRHEKVHQEKCDLVLSHNNVAALVKRREEKMLCIMNSIKETRNLGIIKQKEVNEREKVLVSEQRKSQIMEQNVRKLDNSISKGKEEKRVREEQEKESRVQVMMHKRELEGIRGQIDALATRKGELKETQLQLEETVKSKIAALERSLDTKQKIICEGASNEDKKNHLENILEQQSKTVEELQLKLEKKRDERQELELSVQKLEENARIVKSQLEVLDSEEENLEKTKLLYEKQLEQKQERCLQLKLKIMNLEQQIDALKGKGEVSNKDELLNQQKELIAELESLTKQKSNIDHLLHKSSNEKTKLKTAINKLEQKVETLSTEFKQINVEEEELHREMERIRVGEKEPKLITENFVKIEIAKALKEVEEEELHQSELESAKNEMEENLITKSKQLEEQSVTINAEMKALENELKDIKKRLREKETHIGSLKLRYDTTLLTMTNSKEASDAEPLLNIAMERAEWTEKKESLEQELFDEQKQLEELEETLINARENNKILLNKSINNCGNNEQEEKSEPWSKEVDRLDQLVKNKKINLHILREREKEFDIKMKELRENLDLIENKVKERVQRETQLNRALKRANDETEKWETKLKRATANVEKCLHIIKTTGGMDEHLESDINLRVTKERQLRVLQHLFAYLERNCSNESMLELERFLSELNIKMKISRTFTSRRRANSVDSGLSSTRSEDSDYNNEGKRVSAWTLELNRD